MIQKNNTQKKILASVKGSDYNTISLEMTCDCPGKWVGVLELEVSVRCDSDSGNQTHTVPTQTIDCDFIELQEILLSGALY